MPRQYAFAPGKYEGRYWRSNGFGYAVVAVVTKGIDWTAYIGEAQGQRVEEELEFVASHGAKLCEEDARYFFPGIDLPYRW